MISQSGQGHKDIFGLQNIIESQKQDHIKPEIKSDKQSKDKQNLTPPPMRVSDCLVVVSCIPPSLPDPPSVC